MTLESILTQSICAAPADPAPWGALQDHLLDRDDPRWKVVRWHRVLHGHEPLAEGERQALYEEARRLMESGAYWAPVVVNSVGMRLALVPAGTFLMGSPEGEEGRVENEGQREATIARPYFLGVCQVTQREYREVTGESPSYHSAGGGGKNFVQGLDTDDFPVEKVSWHEGVEFCRRLSEREGRRYRLPGEAMWECACRAGAPASSPYHFGTALTHEQANFRYFLGRTSRVGSYPPNALGLHDMHGNVWEWCQDVYTRDGIMSQDEDENSTDNRTIRGGSLLDSPVLCRTACRFDYKPECRHYFCGLRVCFPLG